MGFRVSLGECTFGLSVYRVSIGSRVLGFRV